MRFTDKYIFEDELLDISCLEEAFNELLYAFLNRDYLGSLIIGDLGITIHGGDEYGVLDRIICELCGPVIHKNNFDPGYGIKYPHFFAKLMTGGSSRRMWIEIGTQDNHYVRENGHRKAFQTEDAAKKYINADFDKHKRIMRSIKTLWAFINKYANDNGIDITMERINGEDPWINLIASSLKYSK